MIEILKEAKKMGEHCIEHRKRIKKNYLLIPGFYWDNSPHTGWTKNLIKFIEYINFLTDVSIEKLVNGDTLIDFIQAYKIEETTISLAYIKIPIENFTGNSRNKAIIDAPCFPSTQEDLTDLNEVKGSYTLKNGAIGVHRISWQ